MPRIRRNTVEMLMHRLIKRLGKDIAQQGKADILKEIIRQELRNQTEAVPIQTADKSNQRSS